MRRATVWSQGGMLLLLSACGHLLEDNGTHLSYELEEGAAKLRASDKSELTVSYETLDSDHDPYYIEITPSFSPGQTSSIRGSYLVVSGKSSGGTSHHNGFVVVPRRLYIAKAQGGPTALLLRKDGNEISVVQVH